MKKTTNMLEHGVGNGAITSFVRLRKTQSIP